MDSFSTLLWGLLGGCIPLVVGYLGMLLTRRSDIEKDKTKTEAFAQKLKQSELEQQIKTRDALAARDAEIFKEWQVQRNLIDTANSQAAGDRTALELLQKAQVEDRNTNAARDRIMGEQKALITSNLDEIKTLKASNAQLVLDMQKMATLNTAKEAEIVSLKEIIQRGVDALASVQALWIEERKAMQDKLDAQQVTINALKTEVAELRKLIAPDIVLPEGVAAK